MQVSSVAESVATSVTRRIRIEKSWAANEELCAHVCMHACMYQCMYVSYMHVCIEKSWAANELCAHARKDVHRDGSQAWWTPVTLRAAYHYTLSYVHGCEHLWCSRCPRTGSSRNKKALSRRVSLRTPLILSASK